VAGAVVAVGLFAYGAALNDVLDVRHDTAFSPDRPIPAGRIRLGQSVVVAVGSLIIGVLGGAALGMSALWITLLVAATILFYNAAGKYIPAIGPVTMGLIHAGHMLIPNARLTFLLPVWLVLTHSTTIAAAVHVYEDKRPRMTRRGAAAVGVGWLFWSGALLALGAWRGELWPEGLPAVQALWPAAAVVGFVAVAWWKTSTSSRTAAAEKLKRYGAMWEALYGAAWLMALDLRVQAACIGAFALCGFAAMTVIRELTGPLAHPVGYR
jgi:4-hydroxybenzoate polyprenyltransferase